MNNSCSLELSQVNAHNFYLILLLLFPNLLVKKWLGAKNLHDPLAMHPMNLNSPNVLDMKELLTSQFHHCSESSYGIVASVTPPVPCHAVPVEGVPEMIPWFSCSSKSFCLAMMFRLKVSLRWFLDFNDEIVTTIFFRPLSSQFVSIKSKDKACFLIFHI